MYTVLHTAIDVPYQQSIHSYKKKMYACTLTIYVHSSTHRCVPTYVLGCVSGPHRCDPTVCLIWLSMASLRVFSTDSQGTVTQNIGSLHW